MLKHEYLSKPSLVGAGVFGLDDVFARIKPFVSRNLRPMRPSPPPAPSRKRANSPEGRASQPKSTGDQGLGEGGAVAAAPRTSDGPTRGNNVEDGLRGAAGQRRRECERPRPLDTRLPRSRGGGVSEQSLEGGAGETGRRRRDGLPVFYFASVDIKHCYDTVDQVATLSLF